MSMWSVVVMSALAAQPAGPDPALSNPSDQTRAREMQRKRLDETPIRPEARLPEQTSVPGVRAPEGVDLRTPGAVAPPEGSLLAPRVGTLLRATSGETVFAPFPEGDVRLPPMILLPCAVLGETRGTPEGTPVRIGGQVYRYRGRTYLLPTSFTRESTTEPPPPVTPSTVEPPRQPRDADPAVADLLRDLERGTPAIPPPESEAPIAAPTRAGDDGRLLVRRRGRVVRLPEAQGRFGVVFDNDPDSPGPERMLLLPSRALERIEALASWRGENTAYQVSGRVYTHEGRTYLMPVLVQAERPGDVTPLQ
jgi:hypothetical protein